VNSALNAPKKVKKFEIEIKEENTPFFGISYLDESLLRSGEIRVSHDSVILDQLDRGPL